MTLQNLISARLAKAPIEAVAVVVRENWAPAEPFYRGKTGWRFDIAVNPTEVVTDFRALIGLDVFVHSDDYLAGLTVMQNIADFNPRLLCLNAPGLVARMTKEGIEEWAV